MNTTMARGLRLVRHFVASPDNLTLGIPAVASYSVEHLSSNPSLKVTSPE